MAHKLVNRNYSKHRVNAKVEAHQLIRKTVSQRCELCIEHEKYTFENFCTFSES
jgi:hypothetical protein